MMRERRGGVAASSLLLAAVPFTFLSSAAYNISKKYSINIKRKDACFAGKIINIFFSEIC